MRQSEIGNGIKVYTEDGQELPGLSRKAAYTSIGQVTASRITMAAPGMCKLTQLFEAVFEPDHFRL